MKNRESGAKARKADAKTKTHHQPGYHKPIVNPTTNYPMDKHKEFCKRCRGYNNDVYPKTGGGPAKACSL